MAVQVSEMKCPRFGNCVQIENDQAVLLVSLDFGPRVVYYALQDGKNVFFEDPAHKVAVHTPSMDEYYGEGATWHVLGGTRLWASPEAMPQSYCPDDDPVSYEEIPGGVLVTAPPQEKNGLQMRFSVVLDEYSSKVTVNYFVKNISDAPKTFGAWASSVMAPNGLEIFERPRTENGLMSNRVLALWPSADMTDPRVYWGKRFITLRQEKGNTQRFKMATNNELGYVVYVVNGSAFIKHHTHDPRLTYPDYNTSFATFTNDHFLEVETLGELKEVAPGADAIHTEEWELKAAPEMPDGRNELELAAFIAKYVEEL